MDNTFGRVLWKKRIQFDQYFNVIVIERDDIFYRGSHLLETLGSECLREQTDEEKKMCNV